MNRLELEERKKNNKKKKKKKRKKKNTANRQHEIQNKNCCQSRETRPRSKTK